MTPAASLLLVAALAVVPLFTTRTDTLNLLFLIFLYAALAQSWNLLAGYAGQVSLGHAAFFGVGALVARYLWFIGWPFMLAWPVGGLSAVGLALVIGYPALRLKGVNFAIGTLALAEIARITVTNQWPTSVWTNARLIQAFNAVAPRYYLALGLAAAMTVALIVVIRSKVGLAMMAIRDDEDAARASGVSALWTKIFALLVSAFMAGLCGALYAYFQDSYMCNATFSPIWSFDPLLIAFVGGVGTIVGPIVGAAFFVLLQDFLVHLPENSQLIQRLFPWIAESHTLVFGLLFIGVVLVWPGGLLDAGYRARRLLGRLLR